MKYLKKKKENIQEILTQQLWQNNLIKTNNNHLLSNNILDNKGTFFLKDIINNQGKFLNHNSINQKYNVKPTFLDLIHIQSCIPKTWKMTLKHCSQLHKNLPIDNIVKINNNVKTIAIITCKNIYWHIINLEKHTPISTKKWTEQYPNVNNVEPHKWKRIFKMSFITVRGTKIQTFQYKIIHNIISCNQWLYNIKIKENNKCTFCNDIDNLPHFFLKCDKVKQFWSH